MEKLRSIILFGLVSIFLHIMSIDDELKSVLAGPWTTKSLTLQQEEYFLQNRPIVIGLGDSCRIAGKLRMIKLRFMAYPFDWTVARLDDVCDIIETDFAHCRECESFLQNNPRLNVHRPIHYPEFLFPHVKWENLCRDFNRRIDRFYRAIHYAEASQKKIYFIIHSMLFDDNTVIEKADKLDNILAYKFPNLNFTLVVLHHVPELEGFISLNCIFKYLKFKSGNETYGEWRRQLASIGLINPHEKSDGIALDYPF